MKALLGFAPIFRRQGGRLTLALLLSLAGLAAGAALLGLSGWFLTAAFLSSAGAAFNLFGPSSAIRGLSFIRVLSRYGEKLVGHDGAMRALTDIRDWLFRSLLPKGGLVLGPKLRHGDALSRLTADVDALDVVVLAAIGPLVTSMAVAAVLTTVLAVFLPAAAWVYGLAMAAASILVPIGLARATRQPGREAVEAASALRIDVLDAVAGHADIVAFDGAEAAGERMARSGALLSRARLGLARRSRVAQAAIQTLASIATLATLAAGIAALRNGMIGAPLLTGFVLAVVGSFEASAAVVRSVARFGSAAAAAERLRVLAEVEPRVRDPAHPARLPPGTSLEVLGVVYAHPGGRAVLSGIELSVEAGERVAIVGASGCGKSTLLSLLLRLDDVDEGAIAVAGIDIRSLAQGDLHARVALLEQDAPVFIGTIRDNLAIGGPNAAEAELWNALDRVRLSSFVQGLPAGLDTALGEGGRTLSAGQARRLCLARVLLSNAGILALDEPTSGLDQETELAFLRDLGPATAGRTVLLVTHAGLPAGTVDRCLLLRGGKLEGTTNR